MSTKLYFRYFEAPDWSRGEGDADLEGTTRDWTQRLLLPTRGGNANTSAVTSVTTPTVGIEPGNSTPGNAFWEWVTEPLDRDVLIAGSITANLWGSESSMSANAYLSCIIQRLDSKGAVQGTVRNWGPIGAELGTSSAVRNQALDATDTQFYKGDRIRARVYFAGTDMAATYSLVFRCDGATADADGDSYLTFTEDFGFLTEPFGQQVPSANAFNDIWGGSGTLEAVAQSFIHRGGKVTSIGMYLAKNSTPTDNLVCAIQADSSGNPSGTNIVSASIAASSITAEGWYTFDIADTELTVGTTYWLVMTRSGTRDTVNYCRVGRNSADVFLDGEAKYRASGTWAAQGNDLAFRIYHAGSTLYLTNTAAGVDPNGASYDAKEAWTSRGGGVQTVVTADVTGPTAPLLATVSSGGNYLEWFTKPLAAFTLSGLVYAVIRAREGSANSDAAVRVEIAVCATDGTSPTVWGASNDGQELLTSESPRAFYIAGDDTAITDGQRLRIRVFFDDAPALHMIDLGLTQTLYYAGTSDGASGDTYITLPQDVTEYSSGGASVTTPSIARTKTIGVPTVSAVRNVSLVPTAVARAAVVGAPTTRGAAAWTTTALARPAVVGAPTITAVRNVSISTTSLGRLAVVGASTITAIRNVSLSLTGIARTATVTAPTTSGAAGVSRPALTGIATIALLTTAGAASIVPTAVVSTAVVPMPTVEAGTGVTNADVHPNAVIALKTIAVTPVIGNANAPPITLAASAAPHVPSVSGGAGVTILPSVARAAAVPTPTVSTTSNVSIIVTAVIGTAVTPTPQVEAGGAEVSVSFLDRPLNLVTTAVGAGEIDLTWDAVTGATTYAIKRDGAVIVPSHGSTSYADTDVDPATTYSYRVKGLP